MNDTDKKREKGSKASKDSFPKERAGFKSLLLINPNYFGNITNSKNGIGL